MSQQSVTRRRILVAVDGSQNSKKAAEMAIECASKWNAELYVIHVLEEEVIPEGFSEFAKVERIPATSYFGIACSTFVGEAEAKAKASGVQKVEHICTSGNAADEIIKAAEEKKVDMIVVGSRGLGRFSKMIIGSVSSKVSQYAHCTVTIVK